MECSGGSVWFPHMGWLPSLFPTSLNLVVSRSIVWTYKTGRDFCREGIPYLTTNN